MSNDPHEGGGDVAATLRTDVGKVRRQNEDAVWFDEKRAVFVVADGMGGHRAGEVASQMAVEAIRRMIRVHETAGITPLRDAVRRGHEAIMHHAQRHPECMGMGTTLDVLWCAGGYAYIAHVGDSRIYRLRAGEFEQITQDHSLVEEMVRARVITKEEAKTHPRRNIITRALGTQGDNTPDMLATDVKSGDIFLLCSDGLHGMVSDEQMQEILTRLPLEQAADALLALALDAGGRDNVSLVLYRCEEG